MCALHVLMKLSVDKSAFTVAVSAAVHAPECSEWHAAWSATNAEEHAVSTLMLGPSSPKTYDTRLEAIAALHPVAVYGPASGLIVSVRNSPSFSPTNTPVALATSSILRRSALSRAAQPT